MDSFSVTDERKERIDFVNPFYYATGAALFTNRPLDLEGAWDDIEGEKVCILVGYHPQDLYGIFQEVFVVITLTFVDRIGVQSSN